MDIGELEQAKELRAKWVTKAGYLRTQTAIKRLTPPGVGKKHAVTDLSGEIDRFSEINLLSWENV